MWVLVILAVAGSDGGRAINTDLTFGDKAKCEAAKVAILDAVPSKSWWPPVLACVYK